MMVDDRSCLGEKLEAQEVIFITGGFFARVWQTGGEFM